MIYLTKGKKVLEIIESGNVTASLYRLRGTFFQIDLIKPQFLLTHHLIFHLNGVIRKLNT